jgi:hypothetical protein
MGVNNGSLDIIISSLAAEKTGRLESGTGLPDGIP